MSKKLIRVDNVDEYVSEGKFYVNKDMILSPFVKDYLRQKEISILYSNDKCSDVCSVSKESDDKNLLSKVREILQKDHKITDETTIGLVTSIIEGIINK